MSNARIAKLAVSSRGFPVNAVLRSQASYLQCDVDRLSLERVGAAQEVHALVWEASNRCVE